MPLTAAQRLEDLLGDGAATVPPVPPDALEHDARRRRRR
jgi:hypothetical protein